MHSPPFSASLVLPSISHICCEMCIRWIAVEAWIHCWVKAWHNCLLMLRLPFQNSKCFYKCVWSDIDQRRYDRIQIRILNSKLMIRKANTLTEIPPSSSSPFSPILSRVVLGNPTIGSPPLTVINILQSFIVGVRVLSITSIPSQVVLWESWIDCHRPRCVTLIWARWDISLLPFTWWHLKKIRMCSEVPWWTRCVVVL